MRTRRFGVTGWAAITAAGEVVQRFAEEPDDPPEGAESVLPERWEGTLILEGVRTEDDREIAPGALTWRELPLPFMFMPDTDFGHMDALICGTIDSITRDGAEIVGEGRFDLGGEAGREAARLVGEGIMRHVSADTVIVEFQVFTDGDCTEEVNEVTGEEEDGDEEILFESGGCHVVLRTLEGVLLGATIVPMPAFGDAVIRPITASAALDRLDRLPVWPVPMEGVELGRGFAAPHLVASSTSRTEEAPPAEWYDDPELSEATPVTVDDDGRVYGHVAQWGVCHRSFENQCLLAPHSASGYVEFHSGGFVATADGERVRVGVLTFDAMHADLQLTMAAARRHYEDSATVWAQVRAGEDAHGIWVAGSTRPGLTDDELALVRALALSGDWRRRGHGLEMIAALSVPVPGFPVGIAAGGAPDRVMRGPQVRRSDGGEVLALVAAGIVADCGCGDGEDETRALQRVTLRLSRLESVLEPVIREQLVASLTD